MSPVQALRELHALSLPLVVDTPLQLFIIICALGCVYLYCLDQTIIWGFLHSVFLFWAVVFPFNYRQLRISGRIRYSHIISVVLAIVIPIPAALVHLKDGHNAGITEILACPGHNDDYTYYTLVLPVSIMLCTTLCLLVVILWIIFKVIIILTHRE